MAARSRRAAGGPSDGTARTPKVARAATRKAWRPRRTGSRSVERLLAALGDHAANHEQQTRRRGARPRARVRAADGRPGARREARAGAADRCRGALAIAAGDAAHRAASRPRRRRARAQRDSARPPRTAACRSCRIRRSVPADASSTPSRPVSTRRLHRAGAGCSQISDAPMTGSSPSDFGDRCARVPARLRASDRRDEPVRLARQAHARRGSGHGIDRTQAAARHRVHRRAARRRQRRSRGRRLSRRAAVPDADLRSRGRFARRNRAPRGSDVPAAAARHGLASAPSRERSREASAGRRMRCSAASSTVPDARSTACRRSTGASSARSRHARSTRSSARRSTRRSTSACARSTS